MKTPRDSGDATDGDAHHPDAPTEPPDAAESARECGGQLKSMLSRSRLSNLRLAREVAEGTGANGDESRRPGSPRNLQAVQRKRDRSWGSKPKFVKASRSWGE